MNEEWNELGNLMAAMEEADRIGRLNNRQLVEACSHLPAAEYFVVQEMMDRLDPGRFLRPDHPPMRIA